MKQFAFFPEQASTFAPRVDALFLGLTALSLVSAALVTAVVVYFAVRYREGSKANRVGKPEGHLALEVTWIIIPILMGIGIFVASSSVYFDLRKMPEDGLHIYAVGKQWMWKIQHPHGTREINELHVPINTPVKVTITSQDVIHSFFIPAFRVKVDAVPGRYTNLWFEATKPGEYHLFCAEYCGTEHSRMIGKVTAMTPADYEQWLQSGGVVAAAGDSMKSRGQLVFERLGCNSCHTNDANARGPNLLGVYGESVQLADGTTEIINEAYIRRSVLTPNAQIVAGFEKAAVMPSFQNQVSEEEILDLIALIESWNPERPTATGGN
ncbi:MAG: cytochrome c oxidase subunit II [Candidatus Poribacteria bacterium]|nr:cytochrome c oxidase subunit II [Candidatus Poribacteria bacterium]